MESNIPKLTREEQDLTLAIVTYLSSLKDIYSSGETVLEVYWGTPKYKNLFFWYQDELSVENEDLLKEFIGDVHATEIDKEFNELIKEGVCEQGLDKKGRIVYFPTNNMKRKDLIQLVYSRLKEKN